MITCSATSTCPRPPPRWSPTCLSRNGCGTGTGAGAGARAASARTQAILMLRWFRDDADMKTLAADTHLSLATGYRYLHEGIDVLAAQAPDVHEVLESGRAAGWTRVTPDGS